MSVLVLTLLVLLIILDPRSLFHRLEPQRVRHQCLICRLLLLLDREKRIFADLGSNVSCIIGVLDRNEVLMRSTELRERENSVNDSFETNQPESW